MTRISFKDSALCATKGLFKTISAERNIKIQLVIEVIIIFIAILLNISKIYLITIIIMGFLVIILEMFNTGFERLIDLVSPGYNKEAGGIKDAMAGVVLATFILSTIVSALILYEPMLTLFGIISKNNITSILIIANVFLCAITFVIYFGKKK